ncbi:MAG: ATP-binding protein [Bacteroidia bacterium]|nr:ATP-binding protein [Bacteroidia bacterium]
MENPFEYGKVVKGDTFTDRANEIKKLSDNIRNKINTIIISPRRWGKSSLVRKVASLLKKEFRFCFIDMFNIRNEEQFYDIYSSEIIKCASNKVEEWTNITKEFLSLLVPKISFGIDPNTDFSVELNKKVKSDSFIDVLNLPEKIAIKKDINIVVMLDEFQNISFFDDPLLFQKRLRAQWQYHKKTIYIIYGSKRSMLSNLFENKSMPFYKLGDTIYLEKPHRQNLIKYIVIQFEKTKKVIDKLLAEQIVGLMQCHPYYIQQLASIIWNNTEKAVNVQIFEKSINDLINQNLLLFEKEFELLSNYQVNLLKLLIDNNFKSIFANDNIEKYNLGSSSNISRILKSLENKGIIDRFTKNIFFDDPAFQLWLKRILK